jgi:hypothetical protein
MNAKKAKALRRRARQLTEHLPERLTIDGKTERLGECKRGAYKALKEGRVNVAV